MTETPLRESQRNILSYRSGKMGIAAVPGSGKTWTLSRLAAKLILTTDLQDDQEILIVTFSNSAADNFSSRIGNLLKEAKLMEGFGYRVRTLHGLANDIIHVRPEMAGLPNDYRIIDDDEAAQIIKEAVDQHLQNNPEIIDSLVDDDCSESTLQKRRNTNFPDLMVDLVKVWIGQAKDYRKSAAELQGLLQNSDGQTDLAEACNAVYLQYERALSELGAVDFADLMSRAYACLLNDTDLVSLLRYRWPYILEDEAQDSSPLQQKMLELLAGPEGNWVRVGDPNQAIYESFSTANPELLKAFVKREGVQARDLPESGRSSRAIISLANSLTEWVGSQNPNMNTRDALGPPHILPTKPGDPQQNPDNRENGIQLVETRFSSEEEAAFLVKDVKAHLKAYPNDTIAVLAATNHRVGQLEKVFEAAGLAVCKGLMRTSETVRLSAGKVAIILLAIYYPTNPNFLEAAFRVVHRNAPNAQEFQHSIDLAANWIRRLKRTEDFLYPSQIEDWVRSAEESGLTPAEILLLKQYRLIVYDWHQAAPLPLDQVIQVVSLNLNLDEAETAVIYRISLYLKEMHENNPDLPKKDLIQDLRKISKNERKFARFSENQAGFEPDQHPGEIVLATFHKSKGLEWDKVYLSSCNNYDFPSGDTQDFYRQESYFLKDQLNLQAELLDQLSALVEGKPLPDYRDGRARYRSRDLFIKERLRVLFVGITRARKSLTITSNSGLRKNNTPAKAFQHLMTIGADHDLG